MSSEQEWQARSAAIEEQAQRVESCADPATRAAALDLVRTIMDLHKDGLERMLAIVAETPAAAPVAELFARDSLVQSLLVLHDLHPDSAETRVRRALDSVSATLQRNNAEATLLSADEEQVKVSVAATSGCSSNVEAMKELIQDLLIGAAPDANIVVIGGEAASAGFVSIDALRPATQAADPAPQTSPFQQSA